MTTIPFKDSTPVLRLQNLNVKFAGSPVSVLDDISLTVRAGETLALVGESGCGKSITSLALMGLLPASARIVSGEMNFRRQDLRKLSPREYADLRGSELAMIFQEPMTSLNPAFTLGDQLSEAVMRHQTISRAEAMTVALQILEKVQIPAAEMRLKAYPHQLSGGMRQRVMIAMALINHPKLLIADEPTTALDVTIQAQILSLLNTLKEETGTAVLMITHDLGVVAEVAQQVAVMYAGQVVEQGVLKPCLPIRSTPIPLALWVPFLLWVRVKASYQLFPDRSRCRNPCLKAAALPPDVPSRRRAVMLKNHRSLRSVRAIRLPASACRSNTTLPWERPHDYAHS